MFSGTHSLVRFRRRAALWLIAAWALFSISQALAACCLPVGTPVHAPLVATSHQEHAAGRDECCATDTVDQPCQIAFEEASTAPSADYAARVQFEPPIAFLVAGFRLVPTLADASRPAPMPGSPAPPDLLFLRLQRFLI